MRSGTWNRAAAAVGLAFGGMCAAAPPDAAPPDAAPPEAAPPTADRVQVRLLADTDIIAAGQTFHIAVVFDIEPHWHIYWKSPGDSGGPTEVRLRGPAGFEVGETRFPRPRIIADPAGITYGYEGRVVLFVPVTAPSSSMPGRATFAADIDWVVCRRICLLGHAEAKIAVATDGAAHDSAGTEMTIRDPVLREHFERLPRTLRDLPEGAQRFDRAGSRLLVEGRALGRGTVGFLPEDMPGLRYGVPRATIEDDRFTLQVPVEVNPGNSQGTRPVLRGLLTLGKDDDDPCYDVELSLPGSP